MRNLASRLQGFTLLELLVALMLIALVAGVALLSLESTRDDAMETTTRAEMAEIKKALLRFRFDVGHFPDQAEMIDPQLRLRLLESCQATDATKVNETSGVSYDAGCQPWDKDVRRGWHGPYLTTGGNQDAWGNPYRLHDPNLDALPQTLWCDTNGLGCQPTKDVGHPLPDNAARLVSAGPNFSEEGLNAADPCAPNPGSDDLVLCLLR